MTRNPEGTKGQIEIDMLTVVEALAKRMRLLERLANRDYHASRAPRARK